MTKKITSRKIVSSTLKMQPKTATLQVILAFAASYHVEKLANGELLQMMMN